MRIKLITFNQLFNLYSWTAVFYIFLAILSLLVLIKVEPIGCIPKQILNLTTKEVEIRCLNERFYSIEDHHSLITIETINELNGKKDSIERRWVYEKLNVKGVLPFSLLFFALALIFAKIQWFYRKPSFDFKLKAKKFILAKIYKPKNDEEQEDSELLDNIKKSIDKFMIPDFYYFRFVIIGFLGPIIPLIVLGPFFDNNLLRLGFEWLRHPFQETKYFPTKVNCILDEFVQKDKEWNKFVYVYTETAICTLNLSGFDEIILLIILSWTAILIIIMAICMIQFVYLYKSKSYRLERVKELLNPPINDESSLTRLANNRTSFLLLENLAARINELTKFRVLMKQLIDENYYLDKKGVDV